LYEEFKVYAWTRIIHYLYQINSDENHYTSQIAKDLNITNHHVVCVINSLEKHHFIRRDSFDNNNRKKRITLTKEGKELASHLNYVFEAMGK
jgi:DNA-binding MarR family transcriptional regulator